MLLSFSFKLCYRCYRHRRHLHCRRYWVPNGIHTRARIRCRNGRTQWHKYACSSVYTRGHWAQALCYKCTNTLIHVRTQHGRILFVFTLCVFACGIRSYAHFTEIVLVSTACQQIGPTAKKETNLLPKWSDWLMLELIFKCEHNRLMKEMMRASHTNFCYGNEWLGKRNQLIKRTDLVNVFLTLRSFRPLDVQTSRSHRSIAANLFLCFM